MLRISNYSLNYSAAIRDGRMNVFDFLAMCRKLDVDGASLHPQNLPGLGPETLKAIRRAYLDHGLSLPMFTVSTNFGVPENKLKPELDKAAEAVTAAFLLGAPLVRVFAGSPPSEGERAKAFERAASAVRRLCERAGQVGVTIGLQNHNHAALCRTGEEVISFIKLVDHANLTFVLDTGQWAGSRGASAKPARGLESADFMESIRQTASLARHVRVKFYNPAPDGSEPWINYDEVLNILRGVHYHGFLDIVYEPGGPAGKGEDIDAAIPRVVAFLRGKILAR